MKKTFSFAALALTMVLAACTKGNTAGGTAQDGQTDTQEQPVVAGTNVGDAFVDFSGNTPQGTILSISDVAVDARLLMIDFWASWCGPCRREMPNVKAAYERFHDQGFNIIGVSLDEDADDWLAAINELDINWPQISDLLGWEAEGARLYDVQSIPATVLIKDGRIVARNVRGEALAPAIEELLAQP